MDGDTGGVRHRGDRGDLLRAHAGAAVAVVRVLETDEPGLGQVDVRGPQRLPDLVGREKAARRLYRPHLHTAEPRAAADLGVEDVTVEVEHHLLPRLRVRAHRHEVALRPGCDEETGLFAHAL